jgi:heavy metal sensor kinase
VRTTSLRLTLRFLGVAALLLGALCASLYAWVRDVQDRAFAEQLSLQSRLFHERFLQEHEAARQGDLRRLKEELESFLSASGASAEIRKEDGTILFATPRPRAAGSVEFAARAGTESFRISYAADRSAYERPARELLLYFAVFAPASLLVAGTLAFLFARTALAPVEEIRRQAERISRANVSERVPEESLTGEFRSLARTFNEMLDRLDGVIQDLQNFAADAAHELRTPLANLRAEIETAVQRRRAPEEYETILASASEEVSRMNRVVGDLLTLARIDLRQYALQKERVRIAPLLEEAKETWEPLAAERGIEIRRSEGDAEVAGDPVALRRVFMNLVHNAVKYNRDGGRVTLAIEARDRRVRISVRDTGVGMAREHLPRLFRRFYRVDKARSRDSGGVGLGLAICKSFVEAHGGAIGVESAPDQGTTFTVELPQADG